ncbi:SusD/RagB family nutrient-binding outer membrane lipoprotein [Pseudochryseolinea flava]|uniref:SusD/RagB family nutrient-binding outer membrane lipoprotein n=1 Tax=Pseudochryseolinea flava TaxID=2059302 RepID=A0A364XXE1_9BACT|nr:SusD/RagB family nutrient-binding outer membrane lipoprotein [Pseudochryseolinea flava]RAV98907.1 SusD/RagB family nutrient-binding outer membrane lipoprotein [Pseudochryseolinea flava]
MKTIKNCIILGLALSLTTGCDKDFVEVNTNPYAVLDVDPALLFAGAQRTHLGTWTAEHTIVQHFVCPYNTGANVGFNFNEDIDLINNPKWDQSYPTAIRNLVHAIDLLGEETNRVNLLSMIRIWKAQVFMGVVDEYGDVPYFDAGKALDFVYFPTYDDDAEIYEHLYNELKGAMAAFNPEADFVPEDLFYGKNSPNPAADEAAQIEKWRKLGNSLLLRLGMRYSKLDPDKAESIVKEAIAGGVMTSNADNAYVKYGSGAVHADNNNLRNFSQFNYAAEPFVDRLKATNDPRAKYILATFDDPGAVVNDTDPDTELENQFGVPIGVTSVDLVNPALPYRGARGAGVNYSQMNIWTIASPSAPEFFVTYAQTSLLLAEAAFRGWIDGDAQEFYENAIIADMETYTLYPQTKPITQNEIEDYLAEPGVAYNETDALELINTEYWVVNLRNGTEAYANFRRSGFPELSPNLFNTKLNGGFARRMSYPDREASANGDSYAEGASAIGGDNLLSRVFWDVE